MPTVRVFRYVEELNAFLVTDEFNSITDQLNLAEWTPVVWIGRLFCMDNDVGEHWFDNWHEREKLKSQAKAMGIEEYNLMIIVPGKFQDGQDGPCHSDEFRKAFWTDVLKSLELSYELLFTEAREFNNFYQERYPEDYIADLEERITRIKAKF